MIKRLFLEVILVCFFLFIFFLIHGDLLLFGKVRVYHDTFASYSEFYYAVNSLKNCALPLWDPYTHSGQPYYYHFIKITGGELGIIFFSIILHLFNTSILTLYNYHTTLHFLVFVFGCFYLARILFSRRVISYYILLLCLFGSHYGSILGQHGALITIELMPWAIALFVLFATGKARSYHIFVLVLIFLLYIQIINNSIISFYFLILFCILYCVFFKRQLSLPKIHKAVWVFAALLLCLGLAKTFVIFSEVNNIFPSLRIFAYPSKIGSGINIISPSSQVVPASFIDYLNLLNPIIGRYAGSELKFYLGLLPAFFAIYAIFSLRNRFIWSLAIPGALSLWVSLGPRALLSSFCFYILPLFKSIRIMGHFSLAPVYISFIFISAFGFEGILEKIVLLQDLRRLRLSINKYFWLFMTIGILITIGYIYYRQLGLIKSIIALSYYFLPVVGLLFCWLSIALRKFNKIDILLMRIMILLGFILILIIAITIFAHKFFAGSLLFFEIIKPALILVTIFIIISYILFFYNHRYSTIFSVVSIGIIFLDLIFASGLYIRPLRRGEPSVPETCRLFEYQMFRKESFWPQGLGEVLLRPAMLYLESSIIAPEGLEYDFYMLKKFWEAYRNFSEKIKRIVMGVDFPKLAFFTDYKVMDDEAVFNECKNLDPELLKRFIYLAPEDKKGPLPRKRLSESAPTADINVVHFDNNRLRLSIDTKEEGFLYYSDGYDKNWRCFIDGKDEPIRRANVAFKAVYISRGRHSILFVYRPIFYLISLWMFLGSCLICPVFMIISKCYRRY